MCICSGLGPAAIVNRNQSTLSVKGIGILRWVTTDKGAEREGLLARNHGRVPRKAVYVPRNGYQISTCEIESAGAEPEDARGPATTRGSTA